MFAAEHDFSLLQLAMVADQKDTGLARSAVFIHHERLLNLYSGLPSYLFPNFASQRVGERFRELTMFDPSAREVP